MAILKRENKYQGLKDIDVFVEESGLTSQYFQVFDFPEAIPQGKSSFLIAGSPFLKDNVEIKIEILDALNKNFAFNKNIASFMWLTLKIGILKIAPDEDLIVSPLIGELPDFDIIMFTRFLLGLDILKFCKLLKKKNFFFIL